MRMTPTRMRDTGIVVGSVFALAAGFALSLPPRSEARPPVYLSQAAAFGDLEVRPRVWTSAGVGASVYIVDMRRWRHWGSRAASARGRARLNDCEPSCAGGTVHHYPARLEAFRIRRCRAPSGRRYREYTRVRYRIRFPKNNAFGQPAGWERRTLTSRSSCKRTNFPTR